MYIPLTFFSTQGSCIVANGTTIAGTGLFTTGSFISGGIYWDYFKFENTIDVTTGVTSSFTASFDIISGSTNQAKLLIVAGGGGGGGTAVFDFGNAGKWATGGGGGGGVVYYDNFTLSSGSYEVVVGAGGLPGTQNLGSVIDALGGGGQAYAQNGGNSYFKNKTYEYTPFTSSFITAYGGGSGAQYYTNFTGGTPSSQTYITPSVGGSGGGASRGFNVLGNVFGASSNGIGFGGLNNTNQGNDGGDCLTGVASWTANGGAGGGGGLTSGSDALSGISYISTGGQPIPFNLTGIVSYFSAGGSGFADGTVASSVTNYGGAGSGGHAGGRGWFGGGVAPQPGSNGVVIIAIPVCLSKQYNCVTTKLVAQNSRQASYPSGSRFNFKPCVTENSASITVHSLYPFGLCAVTSSVSVQPLSTGSISYCQTCLQAPSMSGSYGDCRTYSFIGGVSGGTATFIPCGYTSSVSLLIPANTGYDLCCYENGVRTITGTGTIGIAGYQCYSTASLVC